MKRDTACGTAAITVCKPFPSLCTALTAKNVRTLPYACRAIRITQRTRTGLRSKKYHSARALLRTALIYSLKHICNAVLAKKVYLSSASESTSVRLAPQILLKETPNTGARSARRQQSTNISEQSLRQELARNRALSPKKKPSAT